MPRVWRIVAVFSFLVSISACHKDLSMGEQDSAPLVYDVPLQLDLNTSLQGTSPRSLDYVLHEDTKDGVTNANPYLELEQFQDKAGKEVNLIFVCITDDRQPVSIVKTRLYPEITERKERLLRNRPNQQIQLASGTNLKQGTWRMAIYYGDLPSAGGSVSVDPNKLDLMKPASDAVSDESIDKVWDAGKGQLEAIVTSAKGTKTLASNQKRMMSIPFLSEWVDLTGKIEDRAGGVHLKLGHVPLYPQGTLLRVRMHNQGFGDIKLVGFRILTNSLSFRGAYDFSIQSLRGNAKGTGDLSALYTEQNVLGEKYIDSLERTRAFPSYADFWFPKDKVETLANNTSSQNYYLIWAMPRRAPADSKKSRRGILHLLAYDANRRDDKYNQTFTSDNQRLIPKALIRKPALTRSFGDGFFRLSSGEQAGTFFRLDGVQTPIYNFLDYMTKTENKTHYLESEMKSYQAPSGTHVAKKQDWAGIFPVKLPDNPGKISNSEIEFTHYYHVLKNAAAKVFNSNRYGVSSSNERIYDNSGKPVLVLTLDEHDDVEPNTVAVAPENVNKGGKSNNRQLVYIPKEMITPVYRRGQIQPVEAKTETLHFSTYHTGNSVGLYYGCYILVGWDYGQTYLTGTGYRGVSGWKLGITSRYLGPAFHRPYGGSWALQYPWDISSYFWRQNPASADPRLRPEEEDTYRELNQEGYRLNGVRNQQAGSDDSSAGAAMYWGAEGDWFYHYPNQINGKNTPSGYGQPGNASRSRLYTASDKPAALIRTFSDKPILPRK